jgi:sugar transferase (PEP-CTERM/EpsH1 system associated)
MRVVHVLHSFGTGGLEKGVATLTRHGSEDIEHVILCLTVSGDSARLLRPGTPVLELHKPAGNSFRFLWRLSRALKDLAPDLVHTRNWSGMDGIIAARLAGIRSVVHGEHGWGMDDPDGRSPRRVRVRRLLARWVREFTCVSRAMEQWLKETIRVNRTVTQIYNGVDTAVYAPALRRDELRAKLGLSCGGFVAGVVGRLDPIKDHRTLFQAFAQVRAEDPEAVLLVVGDGPEREALERTAGSETGVRFLGNRADVPEVLRCLDVFVLPSVNEGISNTLLEAMASALPVVATRVGGNQELVEAGETGLLIPPGDAASLARAILAYLRDPDLRRAHSSMARERVIREFRIEAMVKRYEGVYRRAGGRGFGR